MDVMEEKRRQRSVRQVDRKCNINGIRDASVKLPIKMAVNDDQEEANVLMCLDCYLVPGQLLHPGFHHRHSLQSLLVPKAGHLHHHLTELIPHPFLLASKHSWNLYNMAVLCIP